MNEWEVFGEPDNDDLAASTRRLRKAGARSGGVKIDTAAKPHQAQRLVLMKKGGRRLKASQYVRGDDNPESRPAELASGMN